jgi:hypothetical protein
MLNWGNANASGVSEVDASSTTTELQACFKYDPPDTLTPAQLSKQAQHALNRCSLLASLHRAGGQDMASSGPRTASASDK